MKATMTIWKEQGQFIVTLDAIGLQAVRVDAEVTGQRWDISKTRRNVPIIGIEVHTTLMSTKPVAHFFIALPKNEDLGNFCSTVRNGAVLRQRIDLLPREDVLAMIEVDQANQELAK